MDRVAALAGAAAADRAVGQVAASAGGADQAVGRVALAADPVDRVARVADLLTSPT